MHLPVAVPQTLAVLLAALALIALRFVGSPLTWVLAGGLALFAAHDPILNDFAALWLGTDVVATTLILFQAASLSFALAAVGGVMGGGWATKVHAVTSVRFGGSD